jgi:signal transduction histidine kinase/ligand-binding sensor domain-containing protein/DNA-binding response OmpR family regulator
MSLFSISNMPKLGLIWTVSASLLFSLITFGQNENGNFDRITIMDGLSQSSVYCIYQDKKGFIWLGTRDGLNKFDGYSFKSYKNSSDDPNSISNNEVISISEDENGLLWIGTRGGGLNIFDPLTEKFTCFKEKENDPKGLKSNVVSAICRDSKGNIWIGTLNGFYKAILKRTDDLKIDIEFWNLSEGVNVIIESALAVRNIVESRKGNLMIGSENRLYLYNPGTNRFKMINIPYVHYFTSFYQQTENILWTGTYEYGLYKVVFEKDEESEIKSYTNYSSSQTGIYHLNYNRIDALLHDHFNNLWVATRCGLIKFDLKNNSKTTYVNNRIDDKSISDDRINSLYEDCTGVLWIGTESQGVNKFDLYKKKFKLYRSIPGNSNSLNNNFVSAIHGGQRNIVWVGTDGGGLDKIDFTNEYNPIIYHYDSKTGGPGSLQSNNIISLYQDHEGTLWVGSTINFIGKLTKGQNAFTYYPLQGYIYAVMEDKEGNIWTGNWNYGLNCFNKKSRTFKNYVHDENNRYSLSFNVILSIFQDKDRNIWVGTKGGGLNKLLDPGSDPKDAKFRIYRNEPDNPSSLSHNDVYCLYQDRSGTFWIGTAGGLNKVIYIIKNNEPAITFKSYLEKDGLPNGVIYGILEDNSGKLWMSTNNGISKFDPSTGKFVNFDVNDGLQANEFHYNSFSKDSKGRMYFGGINGLNVFSPDSIKNNPFIPKVVFTGFKVMGNQVEIGRKINGRLLLRNAISETNEIELTYRDKEITFEFAALHYAVPKKNKYKYRLLGFNNKWQEVSAQTRSATYTNLDYGVYEFQVTASNNDDKWNDNPAIMKIVVLPPPWKTIWAYLVYLLIIIGLLLIFRKYSLIGVEEKNRLKIEHIERMKIEELSRLKIQFFTNISHELRTPLTLINNPLEDLMNYKKIDDYSRELLKLIHHNVTRLLQMINQLLDFRKIDAGQLKLKVQEVNVIDLINDIYMSFKQHAMARSINFNFLRRDDEILLWLDREKIATVLYNILSNAFKFSPDKSSIIIDIAIKETPKVLLKNVFNIIDSKTNKILNFAEIRIIDTGFGIDQKHIDKIFDRFYQATETENIKFGGSGIGLAIAKEYIEMHSGRIEVESTTGKGSCFKVLLPLGKDHFVSEHIIFLSEAEKVNYNQSSKQLIEQREAAIDDEVLIENTEQPGASELKKPLILVIEDNIEMLEYITGKLSLKYNTIQATNGAKGLEIAIENNPDLIITDLMMPEMDGIKLCKKIKTDINTSHIPIIILTAKSTEESIIEGLDTGADVYLSKPFSIEVLKVQVKTLLESRQKIKLNFSRQLILQPKDMSFTSTDERFLKKLMEVVEQNIADTNFGIKELTNQMGMSHSVIFRKIKSLTGLNVVEFIRNIRLKKAALILKKNKMPISEVSYMVGFSDPKYFSKCFIKEFGITPSEYSSSID